MAKKLGVHKNRGLPLSAKCGNSYCQAIALYEAIDAGFTRNEAMELAGIRSYISYAYMLHGRAEIEAEVRSFREKMGIVSYGNK
jgi:hypothetical protein